MMDKYIFIQDFYIKHNCINRLYIYSIEKDKLQV